MGSRRTPRTRSAAAAASAPHEPTIGEATAFGKGACSCRVCRGRAASRRRAGVEVIHPHVHGLDDDIEPATPDRVPGDILETVALG